MLSKTFYPVVLTFYCSMSKFQANVSLCMSMKHKIFKYFQGVEKQNVCLECVKMLNESNNVSSETIMYNCSPNEYFTANTQQEALSQRSSD